MKKIYIYILAVYFSQSLLLATPIDILKLELKFEREKVVTIKQIQAIKIKEYEMGIATETELLYWHIKLFKLKHSILYKEFEIKHLNFNPKKNTLYLKEKLTLQMEDLKYYKAKLQQFSELYNSELLMKSDVMLLQLNTIDIYSSFRVTSLLYEKYSKKKAPSFDDLVQKSKNLFVSKKNIQIKSPVEYEKEQYAAGDESDNLKLKQLKDMLE